jgi:hypothetical protein
VSLPSLTDNPDISIFDKGKGVPQLNASDADATSFDPSSSVDAREKIIRAIKERRGLKKFRDKLLVAYGANCAITACDVVSVLEAAHVTSYLGPNTNRVANRLLLRTDLHTLQDCALIVIDPVARTVIRAPEIRESQDYKHLHGQKLLAPERAADAPSEKALRQVAETCPGRDRDSHMLLGSRKLAKATHADTQAAASAIKDPHL